MALTAQMKHTYLIRGILGLAVVAIVFLILIIYQIVTMPLPQYYSFNTQTKQSERLIPLSQPIFTRENILEWATLAAVAAYTFDALDYKIQLDTTVKTYFTKSAGEYFMTQLNNSGTLSTVIDKQLRVTAVPQGPPVILKQGFIGDNYFYKIQLPLLVAYQSGSHRNEQRLLVTMMLVAVPTWQYPNGIAIQEFWVNAA